MSPGEKLGETGTGGGVYLHGTFAPAMAKASLAKERRVVMADGCGEDGGTRESLSPSLETVGVRNGLVSVTAVSMRRFSKSVPLKSPEGSSSAFCRETSVASFCTLASTSSSMALVHSGARARSDAGACLKRLVKSWYHR